MTETLHFDTLVSATKPAVDVIFVHGLAGDPYDTWTSPGDANSSGDVWPAWLAEDLPGANIHTLGYTTGFFAAWRKKELGLYPLAERALAEITVRGVGTRPVAFVGHSLGGLVIKQILRSANSAGDGNAHWKALTKATRLVAFIATPHRGAAIAQAFKFVAFKLSSIHIDLVADQTGALTDLDKKYRDIAPDLHIQTLSYYETERMKAAAFVVDRDDADPYIADSPHIALNGDHVSVCKLADRDAFLYLDLRERLGAAFGATMPTDGDADMGEAASLPKPDLQQATLPDPTATLNAGNYAAAKGEGNVIIAGDASGAKIEIHINKNGGHRAPVSTGACATNDPGSEFPPDTHAAPPPIDWQILSQPGGAVKLNDPTYVRRPVDSLMETKARQFGQTVILKSARHMGKSSITMRYVNACKNNGKRCAVVDFGPFTEEYLDDFSKLLGQIGSTLLQELDLGDKGGLSFSDQGEFTTFVEEQILKIVEAPIVIVLDHVDGIVGRAYQQDFYKMLRGWHERKPNPNALWENADLVFVVSTEPYLLITGPESSPFNVNEPIVVEPFTRTELDEICHIYGDQLSSGELDCLYKLLGGHPHLTQIAFNKMFVTQKMPLADLIDQALEWDGPFRKHLEFTRFLLQQDAALLAMMRQIVAGIGAKSGDNFYRLKTIGLVKRAGGRVVPANDLYARLVGDIQ